MKTNKILFPGPFFPKHEKNLMGNEGDLSHSRNAFLKTRFNNLDYLLKKRYRWMNEYLSPDTKIVEIGCGSGFSRLYLSEHTLLTDAVENEWVDTVIDATNMDFRDCSIDVIIASHTIHHFHNPAIFFRECTRVLKDGGLILISEINTSLLMRLILRILRHEGYGYDVDVFSFQSVCNDKDDLWSANCAIPELLFENEIDFHSFFQELTIEFQEKDEFTIFPLSGGVVAKTKIFELPTFILKIFDLIDKVLIKTFPSIFALGRKVVIRKTQMPEKPSVIGGDTRPAA